MSEHDTQPLTAEQVLSEEQFHKLKQEFEQIIQTLPKQPQEPDLDYPDEKQAYLQKWGPIAEQQFLAEQAQIHVHGPFTFLLNQNHNALRGCQSCGQTWVGVMAGNPDDIRWHPVQEPPEEEQE